jgi:predicted transcriptional regulator
LNTYNITVEAIGYHNKSMIIEILEERPYEINISLEPSIEGKEVGFSLFMFYQLGLILTIALILSLVMYSKIRRENLLKNAIRKRIFDYIKQNPGKHYRAILNALNLPMGVLSYHLNQLERGQYIVLIKEGKFTRYYPRGSEIEVLFRMSDIQESILHVVKENQGISQTGIAGNMGVSRKVVNYHINILNRAGLITVEKRGRESACYPMK